ncbi:M16 family metallopeptidase [Sphingomonas sp. CLY1604]|uniref:M16 family metallopeptidase n=1 Tax=Sphingomonas sp. CLY1604 TaxID=3457786 RepID=UPI003FD78F78
MKPILPVAAALLLTASTLAMGTPRARRDTAPATPPARGVTSAFSTAPGSSPGSPSRITVPYSKFTLPNGLTTLVYTDHTVPTVFVGVWYRTGSKDEPPGKSGFAHLFEHLMFQQTANRKEKFIPAMERAGATGLNGSTTADYTNYYETVPTNALDMALWMESDRMGYLAGGITQAALDEQRGVVQNEKRQRESPAAEEAQNRFLSSYYPAGHPYAHTTIGSMQDLEAASLADVRQWFTDHYGASNAVLVLAGDVDLATAKAKVTRYFGGLRAGKAFSRPVEWVPSFGAVRKDVLYVPDATTRLTRTWPVSNQDLRSVTLLLLAARTMTATPDAPLTRALVGEGKVATAVDAQLDTAQLDSRFTIRMDLRPGVTPAQGDAALDRALAAFFRTGPTPDGLASIRIGTDTAVLRALDSNADVANFLMDGEIDHGDPEFFLKQRTQASSATPAEVAETVNRWLNRPYHQQVQLPSPPLVTAQVDIDRSQIPAPGPLKTAINLPAIIEMQLANGLKLVVAQRPRLPIVDVTMQFATGRNADSHYAPGAAAAAFALMRGGTPNLSAAVIADRSWRLDIPLTPAAGEESSSFRWSAAPDRLADSFALASEMIRHASYPAPLVAEAAASTRRALSTPQDPAARAGRLLSHAIYGDGDPRGRLAQPEDYRALSRDAVIRFRDAEIGPSDATLLMAGDVSPAQAKALAERYFGDWQPNTPAAAASLSTVKAAQPRIVLVDAPGAAQSSISVGNLVPPFDKDENAAETLANAVLADGSNGRLNMDLREDKGWTYGFGGGVDDLPAGQRLFVAGGAIQTDKTAAAMAAIHSQIAGYLSSRPITEEEFHNSRNTAIRSIPLQLTGGPALLGAMASAAEYGLPYARIAGGADRLAGVTLNQARAAAQRLYKPDQLVWVVVGDLKAIEPGIRALGLAPVEVWDANGKRLR